MTAIAMETAKPPRHEVGSARKGDSAARRDRPEYPRLVQPIQDELRILIAERDEITRAAIAKDRAIREASRRYADQCGEKMLPTIERLRVELGGPPGNPLSQAEPVSRLVPTGFDRAQG